MPSSSGLSQGDESLVISLLREHGRSLAKIADHQAEAEGRLKSLEIAVAGAERAITNRQDVANGRTGDLERRMAELIRWQLEHDQRRHDERLALEAAAAERARLVGHVEKARRIIEDWSTPVLLAGGVFLMLTNVAMWLFWWMR